MGNNNARIRVLFVIDHIYAVTGGTENQLVKLVNNLSQNRYELHLLCLNETPWLKRNRYLLNAKIHAYHYDVFNHKHPRNVIQVLRIIQLIRRLSPDIAICFFKTSYVLGVLCARLAGVKAVVSTRRDYGLWLGKKYLHLLRIANRFVSVIVTNSSRVRDLVVDKEQFDERRIVVIYNGIDNEVFPTRENANVGVREELGIPLRNSVVGIVAGLRPMKRHETFLQAAKSILDRRRDVSFLVVGDGPLGGELEDLVRKLDIRASVLFLGWKEDVLPYLSIMDIGINCSANEGMSNAIMEYMRSGVPCIVSNAGGNSELIEHGLNGWVFRLDDHEELARLILALLNDPDKRRMFIEKSKERIRFGFSVEKMIREYDALFSAITTRNESK